MRAQSRGLQESLDNMTLHDLLSFKLRLDYEVSTFGHGIEDKKDPRYLKGLADINECMQMVTDELKLREGDITCTD